MKSPEIFFERIKNQLAKELPFVAYRNPLSGSEEIKAFLQKDQVVHQVIDYSESGFVFAPFERHRKPILIPAEKSEQLTGSFKLSLVEGNKNDSESTGKEAGQETARHRHVDLVSKAISAIRSGEFRKVVLSRKEILETEDVHPVSLFKSLLQGYPAAFVYIWYHPKVGCWLGATPEILLQVERNRFRTMSLAGTQKFNGTVDVSWGEKEREEQQLVTDSIIENLNSLSEKTEISGPFTTKAGNLLHLRTDISGTLKYNLKDAPKKKGAQNGGSADVFGIRLEDLISAIHPTPAVCGLPKEPARQFILENENYDREFYTGFLGELNLKKELRRSNNRRNRENQAYTSILQSSTLFVNLRCMKLNAGKAELFVGGGITRESDPEAEWEETRNKAETMKLVL